MPLIARDDKQIHYRVEGTGEPFVFLHSLGTCLELWEESLQRLSRTIESSLLILKGMASPIN